MANPMSGPVAGTWLTRAQLRPFVWVAWLGVLTTALNTLVPAVRPLTTLELGAFREIVLLVHAPATLLPALALALIAFRYSPFAALALGTSILLEKFLEFGGQTLQIFPPEEMLAGASASAMVDAVWDQLFFTLWCCNTAGAAAAGLLMLRLLAPPLRFVAAGFAWGASLTTFVMLLGHDYVGLDLPSPDAWFFFIVFTGYRVVIALTLTRESRGA